MHSQHIFTVQAFSAGIKLNVGTVRVFAIKSKHIVRLTLRRIYNNDVQRHE